MGLNIKNPKLEADIRELARLEGLGLTEVIQQAICERLEMARRRSGATRDAALADILAHGAAARRAIEQSGQRIPTQKEIDDEMYDAFGLPK